MLFVVRVLFAVCLFLNLFCGFVKSVSYVVLCIIFLIVFFVFSCFCAQFDLQYIGTPARIRI